MQIGVEVEKEKIKGFVIEGEVIKGLYQTTDPVRVATNCDNFNIRIENNTNAEPYSSVVNLINVAVVTIVYDEKNQLQFLGGNDIDINELMNLEMPEDFKNLILQGAQFYQDNS